MAETHPNPRSRKSKDLTGQQFYRFTVLSHYGVSRRGHLWECLCECGTKKILPTCMLGKTKSCGCFIADRLVEQNTKHGMKGTRTYKAWSSMRERCLCATHPRFSCYGGRGISICTRWDDFQNFLIDMGQAPKDKSLDRVDNNGNYEPSNCRWATRKEQNGNTRANRFITYDGKTMHVAAWAVALGIKPNRLYQHFSDSSYIQKLLSNKLSVNA